MDIYNIYFTVLYLAFKVFKKVFLEGNEIKVSTSFPFRPVFITGNAKRITSSPVNLVIAAILVSVFSCAEFMIDVDVSTNGQRLGTKIQKATICECFVYSAFILVGTTYKTPLFIAPWLSFTLKNLLTTEIPSILHYFWELPDRSLIAFYVYLVLATVTMGMQVEWWLKIWIHYNFLWNEIFDRLPIDKRNKNMNCEPNLKQIVDDDNQM